MTIEHESPNYAWHYNSLYGVGRFERKRDGALSLLDTGTDCQDTRRNLRRLAQKTSAKNYPATAPTFAEIFDSIASGNTFETEATP